MLTVTAMTFGQACFNFTGKPAEFHPDGTLAASSLIVFVMSNVPNNANNAINLRLDPYPDGIIIADAPDNISWTNMTMGLLNDIDVSNGYYKTETIDNGDGTFTKTYTISNITKNHLGVDTYKNGGLIDGDSYANGQSRINNSGENTVGNGNIPLIVDQATLDQSPDVVATHLVFSYFSQEENTTEYPHITANSSIDLFGGGDSEQEYQIITFSPVTKQITTADPFTVSAIASSELTDITYSVESGPATINGNTITLDGTVGIVTLKAELAGNDDYYQAETYLQFEIIELSNYYPSVSTRLTEDYPLEMPSFYAYPIYVTSAIEEAGLINIDHVEITVNDTPITVIDDNSLHYGL